MGKMQQGPPPLSNGYPFFEGLSFFHKSIREGEMPPAFHWGYYLFLDNQSYATAAFRRMRMVSHEDIGLANLEAVILVDELHNRWNADDWGQKDSAFWKAAVSYLCDSPKNRENDWYLNIGKRKMEKEGGWNPNHPSLYKCILNGDEEGAFHYAYGMEKNNEDKRLWDILTSLNRSQVIRACESSYWECKQGLGGDGFWSLALLYLCRDIHFEDIDIDTRVQEVYQKADVPLDDVESYCPHIPIYYYDMHTHWGKTHGRGFVHWFENLHPQPYQHTPHEKHQMTYELASQIEEHPIDESQSEYETQSQFEQTDLDDF